MSWWNAKYKNNHGEYEITFASKDYEKAKAVEKVCCAVMDKVVKSPFDVATVRHGRWEVEVGMNFFKERNCPVCKKRIESNFWSFCPNCGAKMDLEG